MIVSEINEDRINNTDMKVFENINSTNPSNAGKLPNYMVNAKLKHWNVMQNNYQYILLKFIIIITNFLLLLSDFWFKMYIYVYITHYLYVI